MIMVDSKMSKTEYDLKAMMYPAYDTPHKLCKSYIPAAAHTSLWDYNVPGSYHLGFSTHIHMMAWNNVNLDGL